MGQRARGFVASALLVGGSLGWLGCARCTASEGGGTATPASASATSASLEPPVPVYGRRTTPGDLAVRNLDAQIRGHEKLVDARPDDASARTRLVGLLLDRGTFLGVVADLEAAQGHAETLVSSASSAEHLVTRARARGALHRFAEALADLDAAESLGLDARLTRDARASALQALGRYDEARPLRELSARERPSPSSLGALATLKGELGELDEASRLFAEALSRHENPTPFPVAWLFFEEGRAYERAGQIARAKRLYESALERVPAYAHAAAHLAALVPPQRAVPLLEVVVARADDPSYAAALGEALTRQGLDGAPLVTKARAGFEALEQKHRAAFADHAARFWLGPGRDPARALALAREHTKARPVAESFELALEALDAAGSTAGERCEIVRGARSLAVRSPGLERELARLGPGCP